MDEKILELLTEMNKELNSLNSDMKEFKAEVNKEFKSLNSDMKEFKTEIPKELKSLKFDMKEFKTEMNNRFDKIEAKLEGVGGQFELTNESRIDELEFITDKVNKLEKEIYFLKSKSNN